MKGGKGGRVETNILQHLHLGAYALEVLVILIFEFGEYGVAVLTSVYQHIISLLLYLCHCSSFTLPLQSIAFPPFSYNTLAPLLPKQSRPIPTYLEFGVALRNAPLTCPIPLPPGPMPLLLDPA